MAFSLMGFLILSIGTFGSTERVITNFIDVIKGVPVDYSYNETSTNVTEQSTGFASVPGCPESEHGIPWLYYGDPPKCYMGGQIGPCSQNQRLFLELGTPFGYCNCECFAGVKRFTNGQLQFCVQSDCDRMQFVFVPSVKKCFELYEQGYCTDGQWLVQKSSTEVRCENRTCPQGTMPNLNGTYPGEDECATKKCTEPWLLYAESSVLMQNKSCPTNQQYSALLKTCVDNFKFHF